MNLYTGFKRSSTMVWMLLSSTPVGFYGMATTMAYPLQGMKGTDLMLLKRVRARDAAKERAQEGVRAARSQQGGAAAAHHQPLERGHLPGLPARHRLPTVPCGCGCMSASTCRQGRINGRLKWAIRTCNGNALAHLGCWLPETALDMSAM